MTEQPIDFPWPEVVAKVIKIIDTRPDAYCYQKYTCAGCGNRLTIEEPNKFYETGSCDKCDTITNIKERGCNFMLYVGPTPPGVKP